MDGRNECRRLTACVCTASGEQVALNALELAVNAALSAPPSANAGAAAAAATVTVTAAVKVTVDGVKQALQKTHVLCECCLLRLFDLAI